MSSIAMRPAAPDQPQRDSALHPQRSILVQAPAGSGKTDLLTRRFLRLLATVDSPGQIVAITFTKAAAAEMRNRILAELERAAPADPDHLHGTGSGIPLIAASSGGAAADEPEDSRDFSMQSLARLALARSRELGWNLIDLPAQLRITTIDAFCREIALQQPLFSGLGGELEVHEQPAELYRRAARRALECIDDGEPELQSAIRELLAWRDNDWSGLEDLMVEMLHGRNRWMHYFVFGRGQDWDAVRAKLERPFANAVRAGLADVDRLLGLVPNGREEAHELARFACEECAENSPRLLAECAEIPASPFPCGIDSARVTFIALRAFLQTKKGAWRSAKGLKTSDGFPSTARGREAKARFASFISRCQAVPGLESALAVVAELPPVRYSDDDWRIVRATFTVLSAAAAQLKVVFAETGAVDFTEVAQIAESVLRAEDGSPTDAAIATADGIRHLLVDEFQDTSRRQHQLLAGLIAAWSEREGRTCFVVGDPMQSIYFFREADAELFAQIRDYGLQFTNGDEPFLFDHVPLRANFRTAPPLVKHLNDVLANVFAVDDGSGIAFSAAEPAREGQSDGALRFSLHVDFVPESARGKSAPPGESDERNSARIGQIEEIVSLIRSHLPHVEEARTHGGKYRVAVLGRTRKVLAMVAQALRQSQIPFRAVELEELRDRPEILDALALARALLNPCDRLAWLGVLRAPWCGLSLADLHLLASADKAAILARPVPELLAERRQLLSDEGRAAAERVLDAVAFAGASRSLRPAASLGTWLQQVWIRIGGEACADAAARVNLDLLWTCLDGLPDGEQDLLGPALDAALGDLKAQPDPGASSDCGVQLMTIHKSKGLEFEVVLVPELQALERPPHPAMLSWLERGLAEPDESGEVTEFLVAPFQPKGADRGQAKAWVDRACREREMQELRRLLYVAATRARDELHFFARPIYKLQSDGSPELAEPKVSLLQTAWPALHEEIERRFAEWAAARAASSPQPAAIESLAAAAGESNLRLVPAPIPHGPARIRRLPPEYRIPRAPESAAATTASAAQAAEQLYARHEGGMLSRALGEAVHSLLEALSRLRAAMEWDAARAALQILEPRIAAEVRALGLGPAEADALAARAMHHALDASTDPNGMWILSPHPQAESEVCWTGIAGGELRSVRIDRVFQAGAAPLSEGDACWWIVDYKTAHPEAKSPDQALPGLRSLFAPQLEAYAEVLRKLHADGKPIRAALYYPLLRALDWWEIEV